jgi:hypothetical protein
MHSTFAHRFEALFRCHGGPPARIHDGVLRRRAVRFLVSSLGLGFALSAPLAPRFR